MTTAKKTRDSNIELLRIVAMLLVLIVHTGFFTIGEPTNSELISDPVKSTMRYFMQALSITCVNLFVLISGWFGIRPKTNRFLEFIFQIFFFLGILYLIFYFINPADWPLWESLKSTLMISTQRYWFIKAYILLYLLSPVLNAYIDRADPKQFRWLLIGFFAFQFVYGWYYGAVTYFDRGYSTLSFIGLYLLSRFVNLHSDKLKNLSLWTDLAIWFGFTLITTTLGVLFNYKTGIGDVRFYYYNSPFVVGASLFLFLAFYKIKFQSKIVNWIGVSAFAAYLLHSNVAFMTDVYCPVLKSVYSAYSYPTYIAFSMAFVLVIFIVAILVDKIRIAIWNVLVKMINKKSKRSV